MMILDDDTDDDTYIIEDPLGGSTAAPCFRFGALWFERRLEGLRCEVSGFGSSRVRLCSWLCFWLFFGIGKLLASWGRLGRQVGANWPSWASLGAVLGRLGRDFGGKMGPKTDPKSDQNDELISRSILGAVR